MPSNDYYKIYNSDDSVKLTLSGIVCLKKDAGVTILGEEIAYSDDLTELVIEKAKDSDIVKTQKDVDYNVMTREAIDDEAGIAKKIK